MAAQIKLKFGGTIVPESFRVQSSDNLKESA